jgi:hypothetical protein
LEEEDMEDIEEEGVTGEEGEALRKGKGLEERERFFVARPQEQGEGGGGDEGEGEVGGWGKGEGEGLLDVPEERGGEGESEELSLGEAVSCEVAEENEHEGGGSVFEEGVDEREGGSESDPDEEEGFGMGGKPGDLGDEESAGQN